MCWYDRFVVFLLVLLRFALFWRAVFVVFGVMQLFWCNSVLCGVVARRVVACIGLPYDVV